MDYNSLADDIIKKAINKGCDAAEVYIRSADGISVEAKEGTVEALEASKDFGIALRVIKENKLGFAFTTNGEDIESIIDEAVQIAQWTGDDEFLDIPEFKPSEDVLIFDKEIKNTKDDDIIKNALLLEESALGFDKKTKKVRKAEVSAGVASTYICNSRGVNFSYESTYYSAIVTTLARNGEGESQMGWEYAGSRRISDINIQSVGEGAAKRALELLGSRKISAVKAPVILSPAVAVDFLEILSASLSAEAVQKKRSFLIGKIGHKIMSPLISIVDDGTKPWGTGTRPVDDEGVPAQNKTLVAEGTLDSYIHNTYTAKKDSTIGSGNNLAGNLSKGIVVLSTMGMHTANPISGDFSIGISGMWIENGKPAYPVKEAVISGNILDIFIKVEGIGNDLTFYGSVGSPSILIGDMDISA
jgi:PmbA protein